MKKIILLFVFALLVMSVITSCKKDDGDERDKFVGTWTGRLYFARIGTEYSISVAITKSTTNPTQILIGHNIATVYGNSYTFEEFT